jgi:hypothetical protein
MIICAGQLPSCFSRRRLLSQQKETIVNYSNILELRFDQQQEADERQRKYEEENGPEPELTAAEEIEFLLQPKKISTKVLEQAVIAAWSNVGGR